MHCFWVQDVIVLLSLPIDQDPFKGVIGDIKGRGFGLRDSTPVVEKRMEKNMDNHMDTGIM